MKDARDLRYVLAPGAQVREEDFGLLFYTMRGPRLYFLSSGQMMDCSFFQGELSLEQWIRLKKDDGFVPQELVDRMRESLDQLKDKGVIFEC